MMLLTVILNILATTTAIRVPTAWPAYEKTIPDLKVEQNTYNNFNTPVNQKLKSNANKINTQFYTPKLEYQATDAVYVAPFAQYIRRPSGSHADFAVVNSEKRQNLKGTHVVREPDVLYSESHILKNKRPTTNNNNQNKAYYNQNINYDRDSTNTRHHNPKNSSFSQPVVYVNHNANFPTFADGWLPITGQHNSHKIQEPNNIYSHHNLERKHNKPANQHRYPVLNRRRQYKNDRLESASNYRPNSQYHPITRKNYRDDQTHEISENDESERLEEESEQAENKNQESEDDITEIIPASDYETHKEVPTKPIYPGEGQWAIRGLKHRPFISKHNFTSLNDDSDEKPEGHETFDNAAPTFERHRSKYDEKLQSFRQKSSPVEYIDDQNEESNEDHEEQQENEELEDDEEEEDGFVPTKLLAQVRKTEDEEHLPSSLADARLREVIKDSKIHTVYTEEGYEDIAYDHAGHEKKAEDSEGQAQFNKDALKQKVPKRKKVKADEVNIQKEFESVEDPSKKEFESIDNEESSDHESSASSYENPDLHKNMKNKNYATTKENITTEIKNMDNEDMELEITSEIKIMTQPNNVSTAHKFVKIVPKNKTKSNSDEQNAPLSDSSLPKIIKIRKRSIDNNFHEIEVSKDFLDIFNADKQQVAASPIVSTEKYPYYNIRNTQVLHKNSPLRYAEDMKNIPKKIPGRMTFYEQSRASECPEIPRNVDPIPDRVKQAEKKGQHDEESDKSEGPAELPDVPRLRNLGDKIDCLKLKLFGENPLDSPIFQESLVEEPEPIFKELDSFNNLSKGNNFQQNTQLKTIKHDSVKAEELLNEAALISQDLIEQSADEFENHQNEELEEEEDGEPYKEYEDNDGNYQTVVHKTIKQKQVPESTATANSNPSDQSVVLQATEKPARSGTSKNILKTAHKPIVSTSTSKTILPAQYEQNINFIPNHIYDRYHFSDNLEIKHLTTPASTIRTNNIRENVVISETPIQDQIVQTTEKIISTTAIVSTSHRISKPKHIYDQIDLVDTHEELNNNNSTNVTNDLDIQKIVIQIDKPVSSAALNDSIINDRQSKSFDIISPPDLYNENSTQISNTTDSQLVTTRRMDVQENLPESSALRLQKRRRIRPQRPLYHIFDVNRFLPTPLPPLVHQLPVKYNAALPKYKIFDINKFLPTPLPPLVTYPTTNTVLPKYKVLSEVYYKDEIKPNEQLNVFADVINNIKNSPHETIVTAGSEHFPVVDKLPNVSGSQKSNNVKIKVPSRKIRIKNNNVTNDNHKSNDVIFITSTTTSTTTAPPRRRRKNKIKNTKSNAQIYEEYLQAIKDNGDIKSFHKSNNKEVLDSQTHYQNNKPKKDLIDSYISEDTSHFNPIINQDISSGAVVDEVLGLAPPFSLDVPLVYSLNNKNPFSDHSLVESTTLNIFTVPGMKPPSNHKALSYSDFRVGHHNRIRRRNNYHRIQKRSPYKPSYSEIRRGEQSLHEESENEEKEAVEEEDDYVPKRNRNFHYDVASGQVVYDKKAKEEISAEPEEEIEVEEEEAEGDYLTVVKPTPKPKFVLITTERNGPSFLDYIHQLKNNSNYRVIHDPKPTKKSDKEATTGSDMKEVESTTTRQVQTIAPEFLSILSKVKSNDRYKEIREPKEKSTTTASPEELAVEEEEEEEPDLDIKNSRGGSSSFNRMQIFDINEYLPQPKNYSPKTVIDYSKYKTIERAPVSKRHNISSRYNSEDDDLPVANRDTTTRLPILTASEDNVEASSHKHVDESKISDRGTRRNGYSSSEEIVEKEVRTTTTTEREEVTTTRPKQIRMRGRKRPTTTTPLPTTSVPVTIIRRRTKLRSRPTTTIEPVLQENYSQTQRVVHKRLPIERYSRHKIPHNHKPLYTPLNVEDEAEVDSKPVIQRKRKVSRLPDQLQLLPINASDQNEHELSKPGEILPRKLSQVQIFRKYDPNIKHGGNYRREHKDSTPEAIEVNSAPPTAYEIEDSKEIKRLSDVVPKPFAFYSDPTLPGSVNQLKEPKAAEDLSNESEEPEVPIKVQEGTVKEYTDYDDEVRINFSKNSETAIKNPVSIVKDPSKRLYYYAPVK